MALGTAIRHLRKGDWTKAHVLVQNDAVLPDGLSCTAGHRVKQFFLVNTFAVALCAEGTFSDPSA